MSWLDNFGSTLLGGLNSSVGIVENTPSQFNDGLFGTGSGMDGALGAFAEKIDKAAHRSYLENGMLRNIKPRNLEILTQEPDVTVVIKKRHFSSLAENYRYDLMNEEEKLFIRSVKRLFYNKCKVIAAYEKISKIDKIIKTTGVLNDYMMPIVFGATDFLNSAAPGLINGQTQAVIDTLRRLKVFSDPSLYTTWAVDKEVPYLTDVGEGVGTFELTLVQSFNVTNSVRFNNGSADLTIEDPYKLLLITREDIEQAISEASSFSQSQFFKLTESQLRKTVDDLQEQLRTSRANRNVSNINFIINESSLLYKKVRAIIDQEGREIIFSFNGGFLGLESQVELDISATQGTNGLNDLEQELFKQIVSNIFILFGYQNSTQNDIKQFNKETSYVRQRMFFEFNGKAIIQSMDNIHIFVASKTQYDKKISQGLDSSFSDSILNKINDSLTGIENSINDMSAMFGGNGQSYLENEKNAIVGPEFPTWLWSLLRNEFTRQNGGTHIFAGIVDKAGGQEYNGGKYTLRITARDHSHYLSLGQVNIKPGLDTFDSALYDPVTPFKLDFDASTGFVKGEIPPLLDENIRLLASGSVKAKAGRYRGATLDQSFYAMTDAEPIANKHHRLKFNDPDGFVYRWKRGIGSLTLFGEPHGDKFRKDATPALTNEPFAGQDVMNVLSLLVTGQPYNYNTFLKAALSSASLSKEDLSNKPSSTSFFRSLVSDLTRNNSIWGNFIPFKKMIINEAGYNFLRSGEFDLVNANTKLQDLLNERAKLFDELTSAVPAFANNPQFYKTGLEGATSGGLGPLDADTLTALGVNIIDLDIQIEQQKKAFQKATENPNLRSDQGTLKIFGDDVSFDTSVTGTTSLTPQQEFIAKEEFRKKINYLTQRRLWQVKSNEDKNYFIVDDSYDKNYDIQAFEKSLASGLSTFRSTYTRVSEKIEGIAQLLGLEIYADTQGHIQARPPQYNRIPSSVFYQMIRDKQIKGIQLFPKYLESLFFSQIQGLSDRLEIVEDEIRLRAAALGAVDDNAITSLLSSGITNVSQGTAGKFTFITSSDGKLGGKDFRNLLMQANPDLLEDVNRKALTSLSSVLSNSLGSSVNFDILKRVSIINEKKFADTSNSTEEAINDKIIEIGARLQDKTGKPSLTKQQLLPKNKDRILGGNGRSQSDILGISSQISQFLAERQYLIKLMANAVKNLDQGLALDQSTDASKNALYPQLNKSSNNNFPQILQHMIEDEDFDDYGPGSGKRYVLKDVDIVSLSIEESSPPYTIVEVDGALEGGLVGGPSGLEVGSGGNGISAAFATDYDMWRMYGFKGYNAVNVPFLSDPEGQCAPYAVFLLNLARKNIFQGSVTLRGNEYLQPGEVYYVEDRDLLFYAESVSHSFSYGQAFNSSMHLTYGHSPGEFIPTMLDIIGKGLYTNKHQSNLVRHIRNSNASGDTAVGTIVNGNPTFTSGDGNSISGSADQFLSTLVSGAFGKENKKSMANIMSIVSGLISTTKFGESLQLELRIYNNSKQGFNNIDSNVRKLAESMQKWLLNPSKEAKTLTGGSITPDDTNPPVIDPDSLKIVEVDLGKTEETRSPSGAAWNAARTLALNSTNFGNNTSTNSFNKELQGLFTQVVDVWATFSTPTQTTGDSSSLKSDELSQDLKQKKADYIDGLEKKIEQLKNS